MRLLKRLKCLITRHHWLLQEKRFRYGTANEWGYLYQCQVCDKYEWQTVIDLDTSTEVTT